MTLDGRVRVSGERWVTGEASRKLVHVLRAQADAVAVGMGTVRWDNPRLDARDVPASLLVAPRIKGGYRLDSDAPTVEWLADRRERGDAIVLHGFDEAATKKRRGEFATLPAHEANLRLTAADRPR